MPMTDPAQTLPTDDPSPETDPATEKSDTNESPAAAPAPGAARPDALAIAELCQLAGHPELTAAFLAEGVSEAHVRKALLASRADSQEISSTIAPDVTPQANQSATNPLVAAVKKLTGKE